MYESVIFVCLKTSFKALIKDIYKYSDQIIQKIKKYEAKLPDQIKENDTAIVSADQVISLLALTGLESNSFSLLWPGSRDDFDDTAFQIRTKFCI